MRTRDDRIKRLLPRHRSAANLRIDWDLRPVRRRVVRKGEESTPGTVVDLSLEGALVEIPDGLDHKIGDRIRFRILDTEGVCEIRHRRQSERGGELYGVRFIRDHELQEVIGWAVGRLRGHRAELTEAWQRAN